MTAWRNEYDVVCGDSTLRVREWGDPTGPLVVFHHGTPSSSVAVPGGWEYASGSRARICSFDRPGYGGSERSVGRTVASAAKWSEAIADHVNREFFSVVGTSGGGPHAAATAALTPQRVTSLGIVVGLAPEGPTFDPGSDMVPETQAEIQAARRGELALRNYIASLGTGQAALDAWVSRLPASDQEVLGRQDVQAEEAVEGTEWSAQGVDGWVDDDLALFGMSWGYDPATIKCPTQLLFGASDVLVPPSHGERWANVIDGATQMWVPGGGHWLRDAEPELMERLASLAKKLQMS